MTGGGGFGVPEAPTDGLQYGRQDRTWTPVKSGGNGVNFVPITTTVGAGQNALNTKRDVLYKTVMAGNVLKITTDVSAPNETFSPLVNLDFTLKFWTTAAMPSIHSRIYTIRIVFEHNAGSGVPARTVKAYHYGTLDANRFLTLHTGSENGQLCFYLGQGGASFRAGTVSITEAIVNQAPLIDDKGWDITMVPTVPPTALESVFNIETLATVPAVGKVQWIAPPLTGATASRLEYCIINGIAYLAIERLRADVPTSVVVAQLLLGYRPRSIIEIRGSIGDANIAISPNGNITAYNTDILGGFSGVVSYPTHS
jgi:hypothetical protein